MTTLVLSILNGYATAELAALERPKKSRIGSKFGKIGPGTYELAALGCLKKSP